MGIVVLALAVGLMVFVAVAYRRHRTWTGFATADSQRPTGKTLWDWLSLLVVPVGLALAAFYLNNAQSAA